MKHFGNFAIHMYTDLLFGKDTEKQAAAKVRQHGGTKVMLVYGQGSVKKNGLYDTVTEALNAQGIPFVELSGVQPNPRRSMVIRGVELAQRENVDFYLGIGGASAIDTAKAIALGMANGGDFWEIMTKAKKPQQMCKVGAIPTISAAGSEASGSAVVVDDIETHAKNGIMLPFVVRPVFAILNPELTYTVSAYQTAVGAADIFSHTLERFFCDDASYLADHFGAALLRSVVKYAGIALENPYDYEARAELMLDSCFSHNGITSIGREPKSFNVHGLEAYLSGEYDTAHGAGLAMLMPPWLEYVVDNGDEDKLMRAARFAHLVFDVEMDPQDLRVVALEGIRRFRTWLKSIGMPLTLKEMNIPAEDIPKIVQNTRCNAQGIMEGYMNLDKKAVEAIFRKLV